MLFRAFVLSLFVACLFTFNSAIANTNSTTEIEYKVFYSHLRKLNLEEHSALQFAFGFQHHNSNELCKLTNVLIHTPKIDIPVDISTLNRFSLPKERALKLAEAKIQITFLSEDPNDCDMSVLLQIKPEILGESITASNLRLANTQFKAFFETGLLSLLMPETKGIKLHLKRNASVEDTPLKLGKGAHIKDDLLYLESTWIEHNQQAIPNLGISHITAWIESSE